MSSKARWTYKHEIDIVSQSLERIEKRFSAEWSCVVALPMIFLFAAVAYDNLSIVDSWLTSAACAIKIDQELDHLDLAGFTPDLGRI